MAHAYTPGLRVTELTTIRIKRQLPIPGEVLVLAGERVEATSTVACTKLPGKIHTINVVNRLSITPSDIRRYMLKREGDRVLKNEIIAETRPLIKWFKLTVKSPTEGTIETISEVTGQVLLREPPELLELKAFIPGYVIEIIPDRGVLIETTGSLIQGIFGVGGEAYGKIKLGVKDPQDELTPQMLNEDYRGTIIVGGSHACIDTLRRVQEFEAAGLVVGGIHDSDLRQLLGYELGVAITGTERIGFTLIITEGFGRIPMARRTFELLASREGMFASISGATQIRAGVIRPEIIIPTDAKAHPPETKQTLHRGLNPGDNIRIIREPYFGRIAKIKELPSEPQTIPTQSRVRILVVEFPDGTNAIIPRANVEILEE